MIVETYPDREAWLAARRDPLVIGASEAALALGVSPYGTAWSLWTSKMERASEERERAPLRRGNRWESAVLAEYEDASGCRVILPGEKFGKPGHLVTLANDRFPWLRESPDAFAIDAVDGSEGHAEAKTAMHRDAWSPEPGLVIERWDDGCETLLPAHYAIQGYVQLAVTDLPWNDLCALVPMHGWLGVRWVRLMRDEETQGQIVESLAAWRERHLVGGEAPDVDGSKACGRHLARAFQKRPARPARPDEEDAIREYASLSATIKAAKERKDLLANTLIERADGARLNLGPGPKDPYGQPQFSKGASRIDVERLRREFPDAADVCTKHDEPSVSFRVYRLNDEET